MSRRRRWILAGAFGLGSIAAWTVGLSGNDPYLDHMRGLCAKRCVPSPLDWIYAVLAFALPPILTIVLALKARRSPRT